MTDKSAELKSLREAALASFSALGSWTQDQGCMRLVEDEYGMVADCSSLAVAAFITAANPESILRLLDHIADLETRVACQERANEELLEAMKYIASGGAYDYMPEMAPLESARCYARDAIGSVGLILRGVDGAP